MNFNFNSPFPGSKTYMFIIFESESFQSWQISSTGFFGLENKEGKANDPEVEPTQIYYPKYISPQTLKESRLSINTYDSTKTMNSVKGRIRIPFSVFPFEFSSIFWSCPDEFDYFRNATSKDRLKYNNNSIYTVFKVHEMRGVRCNNHFKTAASCY